jgi:formylglycine-generating enzyme required for sulfatase activity
LQERYRGVRVIGEGGFGRTFLAVDEQRLDWHENYINAPTWPNNTIPRISNNNKKLLRGGSWINTPFHCRSAYRICADTEFSDSGIGLRIVSADI